MKNTVFVFTKIFTFRSSNFELITFNYVIGHLDLTNGKNLIVDLFEDILYEGRI